MEIPYISLMIFKGQEISFLKMILIELLEDLIGFAGAVIDCELLLLMKLLQLGHLHFSNFL